MAEIRRGYCCGCPYDVGTDATEQAFNLGCLPGIGDIERDCSDADTAWACHDEPNKVCCGYAAANKARVGLPLLTMDGVHRGGDNG